MNVVLKVSSKKDKVRIQGKSDSKSGVKSYISEIREEIRKIAWPQADELKTCTKIVISATLVFGLGIYFSDLAVKSFLDGISILCRLVFG